MLTRLIDDHFAIHTNTGSLCCTPESWKILYSWNKLNLVENIIFFVCTHIHINTHIDTWLDSVCLFFFLRIFASQHGIYLPKLSTKPETTHTLWLVVSLRNAYTQTCILRTLIKNVHKTTHKSQSLETI